MKLHENNDVGSPLRSHDLQNGYVTEVNQIQPKEQRAAGIQTSTELMQIMTAMRPYLWRQLR